MNATRDIKLVTGRTVPAVELSPGNFVAMLKPGEELPLIGSIKLVGGEGGRLIPKIQTWTVWARLTQDLPERLGLPEVHPRVFRRLAWAGLVRATSFSPGIQFVDLDSLYNHIEAATDPGFWTEHRRKLYAQASAEIA